MYCINCGKEVQDNEKFCTSCGNEIEKKEEIKPVKEEKKQSNAGLIIGIIIVALIFVFGFSIACARILLPSKSVITNTTWTDRDNSEVIFTTDRINWYKSENDHNDNYYSGKYKFYRGEEAIKYITTELKEYDVTRDEINQVIARNAKYKKENFVVFDIRYDKYILNGKEQQISRSLVPWFGFISDDNTQLDVANMNTQTYYYFTKK